MPTGQRRLAQRTQAKVYRLHRGRKDKTRRAWRFAKSDAATARAASRCLRQRMQKRRFFPVRAVFIFGIIPGLKTASNNS